MYLFSVGLQSSPGKSLECGAYVRELAAVVTSVSGQEAIAWGSIAGPPVGSFLLSTRVDALQDMAEAQAKLMESADYRKLLSAADGILGAPSTTHLNQIVAASPNYVVKPILQVVIASVAPGRLSEAMAWSSEMNGYVEEVSGVPMVLTMSAAGPFSDLSFIASADSLADVEAANNKLAADPGYISRLDQSAGVFLPGATRFLAQKLS